MINKILFSKKKSKNKFELSKTGIYMKEPLHVYMRDKIQLDIFKKWPSFGTLKVENGHFSGYFMEFLHFPDFEILPKSDR